MITRLTRGIASAALLALALGPLAVAPASAELMGSDTEISKVTPELEEPSLSDEEFVDSEVPDAEDAEENTDDVSPPGLDEGAGIPDPSEETDPVVSIEVAPPADFEDVEILTIVIDGTPQVGQTLTAKATFNMVPDYVEYQWFADEDEIEGADEVTLLLTSDLVGKKISVLVAAELEASDYFSYGWSDETDPVTQDGEVQPPVAVDGIEITSLVIEGKPQVGQTLTAKATFNMDPDLVLYQWFADDEFIEGAENSTFVLTSDLVGKKISVALMALLEDSEDFDIAWSEETAAVTAADKVTPPVESEENNVIVKPVVDKVVVNSATTLPNTGASVTTPLVAGLSLMLLGAAVILTRRLQVRN